MLANVTALVGVMMTMSASIVDAQEGRHGHGHNELHQWYKGLYDENRVSCCNEHDCRPTESRTVGQNVEVRLNGKWVIVPPDKIQNLMAPDMGSHVCAPNPSHPGYPRDHIFCVILGLGV